MQKSCSTLALDGMAVLNCMNTSDKTCSPIKSPSLSIAFEPAFNQAFTKE